MYSNDLATRLAALGHPRRLAVFQLLARKAPANLPAEEIARQLGMKGNTLSIYASHLLRAGLIEGTRTETHICYRMADKAMASLVGGLTADCCDGRPGLCLDATAKPARLGSDAA